MDAPIPDVVPGKSIPEVKAFLKALDAYQEWKALFRVPVSKLGEIAKLYNPLLKAAAEKTKALGITCGPFELYSHTPKFNADVLIGTVGRQRFAALGGVIDPESYSIDKPRFLALVAMGKIDAELAGKVVTWQPSFHRPGEIDLP